MNDTDERSCASRGSHGEPAAWALLREDGSVYACHERRSMVDAVEDGQPVAPLYLQPQPTLTDEERKAIAWAIDKTARTYDDPEGGPIKRESMRRLLERAALPEAT